MSSTHLDCSSSLYQHGLTEDDKGRILGWLKANNIDDSTTALTIHRDGSVDATIVVRDSDGMAVIHGDQVVTRQVTTARPEQEFPHLDWEAIAMATAERADLLERDLSMLRDTICKATRDLDKASFRTTEYGRSKEQHHEEKH